MDDTAGVNGGERIEDLDAEIECALRRQRTGLQQFVERLPLEQLANQKDVAILLAGIMNGADVGMADQRGDARLALESLTRAGLTREFGQQDLDRHVAVEAQIAATIDHRVAIAPEALRQPVVGKNVTGQHCRDRASSAAGGRVAGLQAIVLVPRPPEHWQVGISPRPDSE